MLNHLNQMFVAGFFQNGKIEKFTFSSLRVGEKVDFGHRTIKIGTNTLLYWEFPIINMT